MSYFKTRSEDFLREETFRFCHSEQVQPQQTRQKGNVTGGTPRGIPFLPPALQTTLRPIFCQIIPLRIHGSDQRFFLKTTHVFDALFFLNSIQHVGGFVMVYEVTTLILMSKAIDISSFAMLAHAAD